MLSRFDYVKPGNLKDAVNYLAQNPGTRILAGGTDLLIALRRNLELPEHLLDVKGIQEVQKLEYKADTGLFIGAAVTVNQLSESPEVTAHYPALKQGADCLASYQLRNRATAVGNICNASPGADLAAPLLVYEASVRLVSATGSREVALSEFFTGVKRTVMTREELAVGLILPPPDKQELSLYLKQSRIKGHDLAIIGVALVRTGQGKLRGAMCAVAPTPLRLSDWEEKVNKQPLTAEQIEQAARWATESIKPISDIRSSAEYRLHMANVMVRRGLTELLVKGGRV